MNAAAYFFLLTSLLAWLAFAHARRSHARALRRLAAEQRQAIYSAFWRGRQSGLTERERQRRKARDWSEATARP